MAFAKVVGVNAAAPSVWEVRGKPVAVRLEPAVTEGLLQEVKRGFEAEPSVEVGGVLLGSAEQVGGKWTVAITGFAPTACSYSRGTVWLLNGEEMANLWETVTGHPPGQVVGFYRSHMRKGLGLTEEDLLLYDRYFPEPSAVVLLVKPSVSHSPVGGFFLREGNRVRAESSYLEFPMESGEYAVADSRATPEPSEAVAFPPAEPQAAEQRPEGGVRFHWRTVLMVAAALAVGLFAGVLLGPNTTVASQGDPYQLGLQASRSNEASVHVGWNREAPALQNAKGGVLHIRDGPTERTVELDRTQLLTASVTYRRQTAQVRFRLEVYAGERVSVSESIEYREK